MPQIKQSAPSLNQGLSSKFFFAVNFELCEICTRISDVYNKACYNKKEMFTNGCWFIVWVLWHINL